VEKYGKAGLATNDNVADALSGWLTKATNTHPQYGILLYFTRQQWLRERVRTFPFLLQF
jgi:hypothetical protein